MHGKGRSTYLERIKFIFEMVTKLCVFKHSPLVLKIAPTTTLKGQYRLLRNICIISQFRTCACVRETSLLIAGRIRYVRIIDRECEDLKKVSLAS